MSDLELASPAFDDGAPIPDEYGYTERNVNPPLEVAGVPDDAESLVRIVDDPDAVEPAGKVWDHWLIWNVPSGTDELPKRWDATAHGATEGQNDFGEHGYGGPNPPDREHTYRFRLYALDTTLSLDASATKDDRRCRRRPRPREGFAGRNVRAVGRHDGFHFESLPLGGRTDRRTLAALLAAFVASFPDPVRALAARWCVTDVLQRRCVAHRGTR